MRGKIRTILKKENHAIQEAEDGIKGLHLATSQSFDVVLLDIIMPGIDGLKILNALREAKSAASVIIITADIQESVYKQCMDLGAAAVLHKPPREEELLATVSRALARPGMPSA